MTLLILLPMQWQLISTSNIKIFILKKILFLITLSTLLACGAKKTKPKDHQQELSKHLVLATIWFQQSAEMEASYLQSYNWAKFLIDAKLDTMKDTGPKGVILDIDETVLDNSPYEAWLIQTGQTYEPKSWKEWTDQARAKALPGALDFVNYAMDKGVEVFYISNRKLNEFSSTVINLQSLGFPNADSTHILLKDKLSDKTDRRNVVADKVNVLLYIGDNLTDYSESFANRGQDLGKELVRTTADTWLYEFVMLPNPTYGEWESAIYDNDFSLPDSVKVARRLDVLEK